MDWFNIYGIIILVLILVPNMFFAVKNKDIKNNCTNKTANILEQVGRYGTMILMIVNIGVTNESFVSDKSFIVWLASSILLLIAYWICWIFYYRKNSKQNMMLLAIFPSLIFFLSGICREYTLLLLFAILFSVSHIYITYKNIE